jgi:hypothetical protein
MRAGDQERNATILEGVVSHKPANSFLKYKLVHTSSSCSIEKVVTNEGLSWWILFYDRWATACPFLWICTLCSF